MYRKQQERQAGFYTQTAVLYCTRRVVPRLFENGVPRLFENEVPRLFEKNKERFAPNDGGMRPRSVIAPYDV